LITLELGLLFYLLAGVMFFSWSQQFVAKSKQSFDMCFRYSRIGLAIQVLFMVMLWPIMAMTLVYRFTFGVKDDEKSDR
jgi:hypothetical protein